MKKDMLDMSLEECINAYIEDPNTALDDTPEVFEKFKNDFKNIDDSAPLPPIKVEKDCMPCSDPVFTAIMQDVVILKAFMDAVTGGNIDFIEETITAQHELSFAKVNSKRIRLDTHAVDKEGISYSIDMQRIHSKTSRRTQKRSWFYAAIQYGSQIVVDMKYEDLKGVYVTFILSDSADSNGGFYHDYIMREDSNGRKEPFYDIMNTYEIFAPSCALENSVINIFMRFFSIKTAADALAFSDEFGSTFLGKRLIKSYAVISEDHAVVAKLEREEYFMKKSADEIKREIAEKGMEEGMEKGMKKGVEKGRKDERSKLILSMYSTMNEDDPTLSRDSIISTISRFSGLPQADVGNILKSANL